MIIGSNTYQDFRIWPPKPDFWSSNSKLPLVSGVNSGKLLSLFLPQLHHLYSGGNSDHLPHWGCFLSPFTMLRSKAPSVNCVLGAHSVLAHVVSIAVVI